MSKGVPDREVACSVRGRSERVGWERMDTQVAWPMPRFCLSDSSTSIRI